MSSISDDFGTREIKNQIGLEPCGSELKGLGTRWIWNQTGSESDGSESDGFRIR
jgi:hypothetical protein